MTKLAAKMSHRYELQDPVDTENDSGTIDRTYTTRRKIWGSRPADLTDRQMAYDRQNSESGSNIKITVRPAPDIEVDLFLWLLMRTKPNRRFKIISMRAPADDVLELRCEEIEEQET